MKKHTYFARGPFCWGRGRTKEEAIGNMLKGWSSYSVVAKPRTKNMEKWSKIARDVVEVFVMPAGPIRISAIDGTVSWDKGLSCDLDHDPRECSICTVKVADDE